jgi:hypothetical protein
MDALAARGTSLLRCRAANRTWLGCRAPRPAGTITAPTIFQRRLRWRRVAALAGLARLWLLRIASMGLLGYARC